MIAVNIGGRIHTTNDYQSVFDILLNVTGSHEIAMSGYNIACRMNWGDAQRLSDSMALICYNETTSKVNSKGRIVPIKGQGVLTAEDACRAIKIALSTHSEARGIIYRSKVWTAEFNVYANGSVSFRAYYDYKNGKKGSIQLLSGGLIATEPGVSIRPIQPIRDRVERIRALCSAEGR